MHEILQNFSEPWAIRALIASCLVGVMCGVLGCFIVLRNMSLIGDAMAHSVLPGVVVAFIFAGLHPIILFLGAAISGLTTAFGITWIQNNTRTKNDAAIGIVYTTMFSLGVMGISRISKSEGVHLDLKDFLFGTVLGVSELDIYLTLGTAIYVILGVIIFYRYLFVTTFQPIIAETMGIPVRFIHYFVMLMLSFAVVASLQMVGLILVVAMLIVPASTALLLSERLKNVIFISAFIGLISAIIGLFLSLAYDTTPGPAMVVTAAFLYFLTVLFAPRKGLLVRFIQKRKLNRKIQLEDTLKQALGLQERKQLTFENLLSRLGVNKSSLIQLLQILRDQGLIKGDKNQLSLSESGKEEATRLVRAHRLWETYLVNKIGLSEEQIHEDAERYEHLLTEEMLDKVDKTLGFPSMDPHGSPIPIKKGLPPTALFKLDLHQDARIADQQINHSITSQLWQLGLIPETPFQIHLKEKDTIKIKVGDRVLTLSENLAMQINVVLDAKT